MRALITSTAALMPTLTLAAPKTFKDLVYDIFLPLIDQGTKILIALAVLLLFWNVATNMLGEAKKKGGVDRAKFKTSLIWGVIILFVMVSIWGILYILRLTLLRGL